MPPPTMRRRTHKQDTETRGMALGTRHEGETPRYPEELSFTGPPPWSRLKLRRLFFGGGPHPPAEK